MNEPEVVELHLAWWVPYYLRTVGFLCGLFDLEPNEERVMYWVSKGIRVVPVE